MKLYENVVIGNFLYALGFAVRAKSSSTAVPSVINLLQQTPADKLLGDVLLEFPGVIRLIEFKDKKSSQKKERNKCKLLNIGIRKHKHHIETSRLIHWFIETNPLDPDKLEDKSFVSRITPYLDAYSEIPTQFSFEKFIELTAQDAVSNKLLSNNEAISDYLWFLARFQGNKSLNTRGLLLVIDSSGGLVVANLTDMLELRLSQREFFKQEIKLDQELLLEHELFQKKRIESYLESRISQKDQKIKELKNQLLEYIEMQQKIENVVQKIKGPSL